jgi:hypothetical protein
LRKNPFALCTKQSGVGLAYDIAINSYESVIRRLDHVDGRIQTLLAFMVTTTAIVPTVANSRGLSFRSLWLYLALACLTGGLLLGSYARHLGEVQMLHPTKLYEKWLGLSEWEFKKDLIYFAGQDFEHNKTLVERKWRASVTLTVLFFLEAAFLVVWVVAAARA